MTENTVYIKPNEGVRRGPFAWALILAPLTTGVPAALIIALAILAEGYLVVPMIIAVFPVVATVLGAPTYLLFGGLGFHRALKNRTSVPLAGFQANLLSLPIVVVFFGLLDGFEGVTFALVFYGGLGSVFAPIWGTVFARLYALLTNA